MSQQAAPTAVDWEPRDSSWDLVHSAQEGDTEAFALLYQKYQDLVFGYLMLRLGDRPVAEDLTSETFLRAFLKLSSVRYMGKEVSAWLITIARNLSRDLIGSARHRREVLAGTWYEHQLLASGPEEEVIKKCEFERVAQYFQFLSNDQRECIELRFMKQMSIAEAAHRMNRNESALRALQTRAVRRLSSLCAHENDLSDDGTSAPRSLRVTAVAA